MSEDRLLESTTRLTGKALTESKPHTSAPDLREGIRRAKVVTAYGNGLYKVALRGRGGLYTTEIDFIPTFMEDDGFDVDEEVGVLIGKTSEEHTILNVGGACHGVSIFEMGIYFDPGVS